MLHNLIWLIHLGKSRSLVSRLPANFLARLFAQAHRLKRLLAQTITAGRLGRIAGVLGDLFLELDKTRLELFEEGDDCRFALKINRTDFVSR